jgi:putative membrane protein
MNGFILRTLIGMLGLFLASTLLSGVQIIGIGTFILSAIFLGIVNAIIRPILFVLTLPITIVTVGLFIFVLNAAMFGLVAALFDNFQVAGFWSALFGSLIVSFTTTIASWYIGPSGRFEVLVIRRNR